MTEYQKSPAKTMPSTLDNSMRRRFIQGAGAALPLAAILASPGLSRAAAAQLTPINMNLNNGTTLNGALALPQQDRAPALILIHEWWGLNDQIKAVAADYASQGYLTLAVDLFDGIVAETPQQARSLIGKLDAAAATQQLVGAVDYLRQHPRSNGRVGTVGWCFGGGWSINTALATDLDAAIVYYGRLPDNPQRLKNLSAPVLGHFATQDRFINAAMVDAFLLAATEAGTNHLITTYWYDANHAFANPTASNYDNQDAQLAQTRSSAFLAEYLRS